MKEIRDCKGHLVCKAEPTDGFIEAAYRHQVTKTLLPIGGVFTIERDGIITIIKRSSKAELNINSIAFKF